MAPDYFLDLEIPSGVQISPDGNVISIKGKKGELKKSMGNPRIAFFVENNKFVIRMKERIKFSATDKMFMNTYMAHVKNMVNGVQYGYITKLKICSGHFPMQVSVVGNTLQIKNFLGEKVPRKANISDGVKVNVQGDTVVVDGIDKEKVGQTAATIEQTTRITNKDRRIFQDGIYITSKPLLGGAA